jgi:hypothetical protein
MGGGVFCPRAGRPGGPYPSGLWPGAAVQHAGNVAADEEVGVSGRAARLEERFEKDAAECKKRAIQRDNRGVSLCREGGWSLICLSQRIAQSI